MKASDFEKYIKGLCLDSLEQTGFKRFRKDRVDLDIDNDFKCWVGIMGSSHSGGLGLITNIGIHANNEEKLIAKLQGRRYDRGVASYSISLGHIESLGDEKSFWFNLDMSESEISTEADRVASLYSNEGLGYIKSLANYKDLAEKQKKMVSSLGGFPQRYATSLYLDGDINSAREYLFSMSDEDKECIEDFYEPFLEFIDKD